MYIVHLNFLQKGIDYSREIFHYILYSVFYFQASFSFHKLIPKNTHMTTLYTNLSLYITFTMINYIRQESFCKSFSSLSYIRRISGLFIANAMWTHWHVLSKM